MEVIDIGSLIIVFVGIVIFGCVFNVLGNIIDLDELFLSDIKCNKIYCEVLIFD